MPREPRKPSEYIVHLLMEGSQTVDVRFNTLEEVSGWYKGKFAPKAAEDDLIPVPTRENSQEILFVRPRRVSAIHVEPVFSSSVGAEMFG
ncbi:MAG: hypothetical protein HC918_08590 [Oscillatoriales cyanobacterium SM2_1_8]|nr:hypothetical protein [Oscillatoriales cyanobacterium SM2_1_8]